MRLAGGTTEPGARIASDSMMAPSQTTERAPMSTLGSTRHARSTLKGSMVTCEPMRVAGLRPVGTALRRSTRMGAMPSRDRCGDVIMFSPRCMDHGAV